MYVILLTVYAIIIGFSSKVRCYTRYIIYFFFIGIVSIISSMLFLLRPRDSKNAVIPSKIFIWLCKLIGLTTSLEGRENIIEDSGCVTVINHQSVLDVLAGAVFWAHSGNSIWICSNHIVFHYLPFAAFMSLCGGVLIDTKNPEKARKKLNETRDLIKYKNKNVVFFPEGKRNFTNNILLPFRKGAFHLALDSECPIQPVVISRFTFLGEYRFDSGHIKVKVLPAIPTEGYTKENIDALVEKLYNVVLENID